MFLKVIHLPLRGKWNAYSGIVNGNTLRKKHNEWVKMGVYENAYKKSLKKYLKTTKITEELKYQSIDSTFIEDVNGSKYSTHSGIYKRRKGEASKGIKVTSLVTTNGIPISITINQGHEHDSPRGASVLVENCIFAKMQFYQNQYYRKSLITASLIVKQKNIPITGRL